MTSNIKLEELNLVELNLLLSHLRLGSGHLKKQLSSIQLSKLLSLGSLNQQQLISVSSNRVEKSGNLAVVLNTVITSIFGAWMGFSGFLGLHLDSYTTLFGITIVTFFSSFIVGYFSFQLTTKSAKSALHNQRIHNLQLKVLKLITSKENDTLNSLIKYLNHSHIYLRDKSFSFARSQENESDKQFFNFEENTEYSSWFSLIKEAILFKTEIINEKEIYRFYSDRLIKILAKTNESIELSYLVAEPLQASAESHTPLLASQDSFIQLLSNPGHKSVFLPNRSSWLRQNCLALLTGLFPTLLGCFSSMFVFLAGGPNLAKELGLLHLEQVLRNPSSRLIEFTMAVCLTLYFGISFLYNNYKNYIREQEVEKTKQSFSHLEKEDIFLKRKLSILTKLKTQTKRIINIYTAIENIDQFYQLDLEKITLENSKKSNDACLSITSQNKTGVL
ncbi:MAG: hypothetical protein H0U73_05535 [Tatlockia sp.]|nr:hypothetical protein [Tatlockia sp.]